MIKNFVNAVQFLTIVTVSKKNKVHEGDLAQSMVYFPVVGFLIGFVLVNVDKVLSWVLPHTITNLFLLVVSVLLTRALHIDGFADTLDGMMGGHDSASRLAIMKDSRLGTAGAAGILFLLLTKYLCLNNLFEYDKAAALLTAPMLARWSHTLMAFKADYCRHEGMGKFFIGRLRTSSLAAASVIAVGLSAFVIVRLDMRSAALVLSLLSGVIFMTYLGRKYLVRKIGGISGDTVGAVSELNEVVVLLLFVIFSNGH